MGNLQFVSSCISTNSSGNETYQKISNYCSNFKIRIKFSHQIKSSYVLVSGNNLMKYHYRIQKIQYKIDTSWWSCRFLFCLHWHITWLFLYKECTLISCWIPVWKGVMSNLKPSSLSDQSDLKLNAKESPEDM